LLIEHDWRIVGVVRDPSQGVVTGATVTVTNERTGEKRTSTTDEQGYYAFLGTSQWPKSGNG
jgi:hypothetical protein